MRSLALAAHAAAPEMTAATIAFYATAATIIPVLFLAIAVQGRTYENLLKAFLAMDRRWPGVGTWYQQAAAAAAAIVLLVIACLIVGYAAISEVVAVYALSQQQASGEGTVLIGTVLMIIATAAGPVPGLHQGRDHLPPDRRAAGRTGRDRRHAEVPRG